MKIEILQSCEWHESTEVEAIPIQKAPEASRVPDKNPSTKCRDLFWRCLPNNKKTCKFPKHILPISKIHCSLHRNAYPTTMDYEPRNRCFSSQAARRRWDSMLLPQPWSCVASLKDDFFWHQSVWSVQLARDLWFVWDIWYISKISLNSSISTVSL